MPRKKKIIIIAASSIITILLFISFILPLIIRNKAIEAIQEATGRKTAIESISINPLTLTVGINKLVIEEKGGGQFINIGRVSASLGLASIFKRAIILSSVDINSPSFSFARTAPNLYSFTDILELQKSRPKPKSSSESRFSINNISIENGSVDFNDMAVDNGRKHTVRKLEVKIPFISNIPYLVEKYTDPKLSAVINDAPFSFEGKLKPLSKTLETSVHIDLTHLNLPELAAYSPQKLPAELRTGNLTINTDISYRVSSDKKPELTIKGLIKLDDFALFMRNGQPLVKLPELAAKAEKLEVFSKIFEFESISFDRLEMYVDRDAKGNWAYKQLLPDSTQEPHNDKTTKKVETKSGENNISVAVLKFLITDSTVHFNDLSAKGGFKNTISKINLQVNGFNNAKDKSALYKLSMLIDEAAVKSDGQFSITPLTTRANLDLSGLLLQKGWPYSSQYLTAPVNGVVDLYSDFNYSKENGLITENGKLAIKNLSTRFTKTDGLDLALLTINGTSFKQKDNNLSIGEILLSNGNLKISKDLNGSLSPLSILTAKQPANATQSTAAAAEAKSSVSKPAAIESRPFNYNLKQFKMERFNTTFTDKTKEGLPTFTLKNTSISLANLNGPKFTPAQLRFTSIFGKNSRLKASGLITPYPFRYKGSIDISQLQINDFDDYFPDSLNLEVISGSFDTKLKLDIALKDGKPTGTFSGNSGIRAFHSIDSISEEDLLKWESLQFDSFSGSLEPFNLNISEIALNNFYSRIIVRKNGTLNLQNLVAKDEAEKKDPQPGTVATTASTAAAIVPTPAATVKTGQKSIKVGAITVQGGTLNFTDNHLPQNFTTTFFNLGGRVSGLSSENAQMADVDLRGNLENHSPLQITGKINPLREDLFIDLIVSFKDIELSPATPYTGTFLGYSVEKGKLFLDLKYHIEDKKLNSENKIFLDQFTFGNKVESEKATNLPVKLGLALLKDRKGEIHLDVPVTGRTDDPQFSIWRLVIQVLKNMLVKAATSPFSMLSSMFGNGEDLSTVLFSSGSGSMAPQEEAKLNALSKALADRPALKLELKAYVDRDRDTENYKIELLDRKIRNEKYLTQAKVQQTNAASAQAVKVTPEEYSVYLKAVYKKEKFPKPRNMIGLVKDLPDNEMKKLIVTHTVVGNDELRTLAQERNNAVMNYLINKGGLNSQRVFQKIDDIYKKPEKEGITGSRVELNAIVQ